ncbi:MAG: hypothetical protein JOY66_17845 [Acetobacteraceae bacterium]|nr:hypothetical protein [Acetobacteraceae bacterium]
MRALRRLLVACLASLAMYAVLFGCVLDRPLAYGFLEAQIDAKLARAAAIVRPKLVILAGSNAPYSHRCALIEEMLGTPCVNGGVAVGIGLDYLFARWRERLRPGDVVYLPMEEAQYARARDHGSRAGRGDHVPPRLAHPRPPLPGPLGRRAVRLRPALRGDGGD